MKKINLSNKILLSIMFTFAYSNIVVCESIKILTFGDSGTGDKNQLKVADSMKRVCDKIGCDFGVMLGDNFYSDGVKGVDDAQFYKKFELPYGPIQIPFYVSLGNHDDRGDTQAQIDYTHKSNWWNLPSRYYSKVIGNVLIIGIDTNDFDRKQRDFVEETLKNSNERWKIVFGHHPIYSYGMHGHTSTLKKYLLPIMCKYGSAYLAGHDHDLQVLQASCGLPLIVSGAAAKLRNVRKGSRSIWAKKKLGYFIIELTDSDLIATAYDHYDREIYAHNFNSNIISDGLVYQEIDSKSMVTCSTDELIEGIKFDTKGDKHIQGVFCKKHSNLDIDVKTDEQEVNNLIGKEYDVMCPEFDQAIVGFSYHDGFDDHVNSIFCRSHLSLNNGNTYFKPVLINDKKSSFTNIHCDEVDHYVVGVSFDDYLDNHISGIFCREK